MAPPCMNGTIANPLPNTNEPASAKYRAMRPRSGQVDVRSEGVTDAASVRLTPANGSHAPADLADPNFPWGGRRTNRVTRGPRKRS